MQKVIKFHNPEGPAFNKGEVWSGCNNDVTVKIVSTERYDEGKYDVWVNYVWIDQDIREVYFSRDAWNFQVRYYHSADEYVK